MNLQEQIRRILKEEINMSTRLRRRLGMVDNEFYRLMMQAAASPNDVPITTTVQSIPLSMPYTKQDEDMLHHALKRMGKKHKHVTSSKGSDPEGVNKASPVPRYKKNRYGV